eukprot:s223_g40.t2
MRPLQDKSALPGEAAYLPSIEQQQGRPEIFDDPREWYAQAQAKSVYLECRGQRGLHPKDAFFWIERASLPQSGPLFEDVKAKLGCMLVAVEAEVIHEISIEKAQFSVNSDRDALLGLVDRLFTSRSAFDRFAKFAALSRLGRSCYTREDRQPFSVLAHREGFERLGELLDSDCSFDPRKAEVEKFDSELQSLFEEERSKAAASGGGWQRAVRCAIQDFKWGDYSVEPNTTYNYTLHAIYGNADLGVQDPGREGPATAGPGMHVRAKVSLEVQTTVADGDQVHFNRGVAGSQRFSRLSSGTRELGPRSAEQWQWLSHGLEEALLGFIQRAGEKWGLRCAFYEAHYPPVIRALADARRRGASVSIVVDWKAASWSEDRKVWTQRGPQHLNYWALADAGFLNSGCVYYRTQPASAISHNKFIVLVTPDGQAIAVWTGSTNITAGAIFGHSNVGHVVTQPEICQKYLEYWERLSQDPEKKELAAFNEKGTPLPSQDDWTRLVLFSPRLCWADSLSFIAQLILRARSSVAFTAAFGIGREVAPALLAAGSQGAGVPIPTYLLLESQGNWQASRDAVQELQRKSNVKVAFGMHLEAPAHASDGDPIRGSWIPEKLTGLNEHVRYVHTKILLIDFFSDEPIVITGSGNFSRASMESNDENMLVLRGDRNLCDAYAVEFFRIFEHMQFRNRLQGYGGAQCASKSEDAVMCRCGQAGNILNYFVSIFCCRKDCEERRSEYRAEIPVLRQSTMAIMWILCLVK